jgi:ankyrin repeat protein
MGQTFGQGQDPNTAYLLEVGRGDAENVRLILSYRSAAVNHATASSGWTALILASRQGDLPMVQLLLEFGADVNLTDNEGRTPIHEASQRGFLTIVQFLISKGGNYKADGNGRMPLYDAASHGHLEVVQFLSETFPKPFGLKNGHTPLHIAAVKGHLEVVQYLVQKGAYIKDCVTIQGSSPLHEAAGAAGGDEQCLAVVECLVALGADPNLADVEGWTPLMRAADAGNTAIVTCLVTHKADVNKFSVDGFTALHRAAKSGHLATVSVLLQHGASLKLKTNEGDLLPVDVAATEEIKQAMVAAEESRKQIPPPPSPADEDDKPKLCWPFNGKPGSIFNRMVVVQKEVPKEVQK